jgi:hypothetical protein
MAEPKWEDSTAITPKWEDSTAIVPKWDETTAVGSISDANETLLKGALFDATLEEREDITSNLTPQDLEFQTAKIYYDQKFGVDHADEMVTAQIEYEYGDDATPQVANAMNHKAAVIQEKRTPMAPPTPPQDYTLRRYTDPETGISIELPVTELDLGVPDPVAYRKAERSIANSLGSSWARIKSGVKMTPEWLTASLAQAGLQPPKNQLGAPINVKDIEQYANYRDEASKAIEEVPLFQELRELAKPDIEAAGEFAQRYRGSKTQSLMKSVKEGNWEQFGTDLADGIALEAPNFGVIVALGAIDPNLALAYAGGSSAASRYATGVAEGESPMDASAAAAAHGIAEIVFERIGSTGMLADMAKRKAKDEAIGGFTRKALEIAREPFSEVGTQITQNVVDQRPWNEGILEAGTIGLAFGAGMTSVTARPLLDKKPPAPEGAQAEVAEVAPIEDQRARVGSINTDLRSNFEANGVVNIDELHKPQAGKPYSVQELLSAFFYAQDVYDASGNLKPEDLSVAKQTELSILNGDSATVDIILDMLTEFESTWDGSHAPIDVTNLDTSAGMQLFASLHQRGINFDAGTVAQTVGNPKNAELIAELDPLIRDADRIAQRQAADAEAKAAETISPAEERAAAEQRAVDRIFFAPWTLDRASELRRTNSDEQIDAIVDQMSIPDAQKAAVKLALKTPNEAGVAALNKIKDQLIIKHNAESPWTLGDANRARRQNSNEKIDELVDQMDIPEEQKILAKNMIKTPNEASVSAFNEFEVPSTPTDALDEATLDALFAGGPIQPESQQQLSDQVGDIIFEGIAPAITPPETTTPEERIAETLRDAMGIPQIPGEALVQEIAEVDSDTTISAADIKTSADKAAEWEARVEKQWAEDLDFQEYLDSISNEDLAELDMSAEEFHAKMWEHRRRAQKVKKADEIYQEEIKQAQQGAKVGDREVALQNEALEIARNREGKEQDARAGQPPKANDVDLVAAAVVEQPRTLGIQEVARLIYRKIQLTQSRNQFLLLYDLNLRLNNLKDLPTIKAALDFNSQQLANIDAALQHVDRSELDTEAEEYSGNAAKLADLGERLDTKRFAEDIVRLEAQAQARKTFETIPRKKRPRRLKKEVEAFKKLREAGLDFEAKAMRIKGEIAQDIKGMRDMTGWQRFMTFADFQRTLMFSTDISAMGRQGATAWRTNPLISLKASGIALRAMVTEKNHDAIDRKMKEDPRHIRRVESNLAIIDLNKGHEARQELMASRLLEKFPWIRGSNRHMATYLNIIRTKIFDQQVWIAEKVGGRELTLEETKQLAHGVNVMTGRGSLGKPSGHLDQDIEVARTLTTIFTAPRFFASQIQLGTQLRYLLVPPKVEVDGETKRNKAVTAIMWKNVLSTVAVETVAQMALAPILAAFDWEQELDPESSEFLSFRKGDLVINLTGGRSRILGLVLTAAESAAASYGLGELEYQGDVKTRAMRHLSYKQHPLIATLQEIAFRENAIGQEVSPVETAITAGTPLSLSGLLLNLQEANEWGGVGTPADAYAAFLLDMAGMSAQIYEDRD